MNLNFARFMENPLVAQLRSELAVNSRLRWLLFSVAMLLMLYLVLVVDDWRLAANEDYATIAVREARLDAIQQGDEADYGKFYEGQKAAHEALRSKFWRAGSAGLAGAELQSWLRSLAREHSLEGRRLELSDLRPATEVTEPLWRLEAEISGEITPSNAVDLVVAIAESERAVIVDRLDYQPSGDDRLSLRVTTYFILGDDGAI